MYTDPIWIILMLVSTVIGMVTQGYINSAFRKWSQVPLHTGRTGAEVARIILDSNGAGGVPIRAVGGQLTDHYDPRNNTLALSEPVYAAQSVAAAGVAAHESGHAIQHAQGYVWGKVRSSLVPVANFGSRASMVFIIMGLVIGFTQLVWVGVAFYAAGVLFQVVTLPVEFDASRRALSTLSTSGVMTADQLGGAKQVLTAAALTYVGAALIASLQLLYWIGLARSSD